MKDRILKSDLSVGGLIKYPAHCLFPNILLEDFVTVIIWELWLSFALFLYWEILWKFLKSSDLEMYCNTLDTCRLIDTCRSIRLKVGHGENLWALGMN